MFRAKDEVLGGNSPAVGHTGVVATTVRVTCAQCGAVEVPIDAAQLVMAVDGPDTRNTLMFGCPDCGTSASQRVTERGTRLLSSAGVVLMAPDASAVESEHGSI